jgi:hypothetical protein
MDFGVRLNPTPSAVSLREPAAQTNEAAPGRTMRCERRLFSRKTRWSWCSSGTHPGSSAPGAQPYRRTFLFVRVGRGFLGHRAVKAVWSCLVLGLVANIQVAFGQRTSFGFIGGVNLTHDFPTSRDPSVPGVLTEIDRYSARHGLIAGITVEVDLWRGLSMEGNALRRQLDLRLRSVSPDGTIEEGVRSEIGTWEWPILLKYRMPAFRAVRPIVEAGPSFRTRHNPVPTEPSQIGGTVGAGAEIRAGRFRVSPVIRYTRWRHDGDFPRIATKRDQIEFVTGISYATSLPSWRVGGRKLRFGFVGGAPFTSGLEQLPPPERMEESQGYTGGLAAEVELNRRWSVEVNGLYRPFRANSVGVSLDPRFGESRFEFTVLTWQFPVLGKYRFCPESTTRPVVEAGPSFRLSGNLNGYNPSHYGFTAGGGVEKDYKALRISPIIRYTRWAADSQRERFWNPATASNQVEFLVSLTF